MSNIAQEIEAFLDAHKMAATTFGVLALKDRHFVRQVRNGRRLWPETEKRVRDFMVTYRPEADAA